MKRADRGIETMDLNSFDVLLGGVGGNPTDLGIKVSKTLFAPRLGLVYRLNDKTVFRSGYGLTYKSAAVLTPAARLLPVDDQRELRGSV